MAKDKSEIVAGIVKDMGEDWDSAKNAPAEPRGFQELPPGIKGGIAQVASNSNDAVIFDMNDSNQRRLQIVCIAITPPEAAGIQFRQFYTFADRKTRSGKVITKQQTLKGLSTDLQLMGSSLPENPADLLELGDEIAGAYFTFNTSIPKNPTFSPFVNLQGTPTTSDLEEAGITDSTKTKTSTKSDKKPKQDTKIEKNATPPEVDDVWYYKPPRKRKYIKVCITEVEDDYCDLAELDEDDQETGQVYENVDWSVLVEDPA